MLYFCIFSIPQTLWKSHLSRKTWRTLVCVEQVLEVHSTWGTMLFGEGQVQNKKKSILLQKWSFGSVIRVALQGGMSPVCSLQSRWCLDMGYWGQILQDFLALLTPLTWRLEAQITQQVEGHCCAKQRMGKTEVSGNGSPLLMQEHLLGMPKAVD